MCEDGSENNLGDGPYDRSSPLTEDDDGDSDYVPEFDAEVLVWFISFSHKCEHLSSIGASYNISVASSHNVICDMLFYAYSNCAMYNNK